MEFNDLLCVFLVRLLGGTSLLVLLITTILYKIVSRVSRLLCTTVCDKTEILLKVALNTIKQTNIQTDLSPFLNIGAIKAFLQSVRFLVISDIHCTSIMVYSLGRDSKFVGFLK